MKAFTFLLLSGLLLVMGCGDSTTGNEAAPGAVVDAEPDKPSPKQAKSVTFASFLDHFIDDTTMEEWPEEAQDPLVLNGAIYKDAEMEPMVSVTFSEIPAEYYDMIPVGKLKQLTPGVPETKAPLKAFRFYGFRKIKTDKYWLLSFFALKLRRNENNEYHGHPFFLATFTPEGELVDDFVWWTIEDDDLQAWDYVDVEEETLLIGGKSDMNDDVLSEVWQKTVIGEGGKFSWKD